MPIRPPFSPEQWADIEARARERERYHPPMDWNRPLRGHSETGPTKPLPWAEITEAEIEAWRMRKLDERWATTDTIARCLTYLEKHWGGYLDPEGI